MEGGTSSENYNCLAEGCGRCFTSKESACSHICAVHSLMGLHCPGSGFMAASHVLTIFRTGKHSGSTWAVSMVLVWKHPMDVRIQRLCSFDIGSVNEDMGCCLACKTHCTLYFTQPTHLLIHNFNLKILRFPNYVITNKEVDCHASS